MFYFEFEPGHKMAGTYGFPELAKLWYLKFVCDIGSTYLGSVSVTNIIDSAYLESKVSQKF